MEAPTQSSATPVNNRSRAYLYTAQGAYQHEDVGALGSLSRTEEDVLWVMLSDPEEAEIQQVCTDLCISEYVQQSMQERHRRPKLISLEDVGFMAVITVALKGKRPQFAEVQLVIGRNVLITVSKGQDLQHEGLHQRLSSLSRAARRGSDYLAFEWLDLVIDHYVQSLDVLEVAVEAMEQRLLLHGFQRSDVQGIYRLRRDLLRIEMAIAPLAEICRRMARLDTAFIETANQAYFAEVSDRALRVTELIHALRDALAFAFEGGQMLEQMKQTDTGRKLAAWAAILAVPTAIAGIYGMNFKFMPELEWSFGYPMVLTGMGSLCGFLYYKFKKAGWL